MDHQFDRYYMNSLMHDTVIKANFGGTVRQSGQTSSLFELGNTNQDESKLVLDFNYSLPDTGVSAASLFLRRKSIQNGNVIDQASGIQVDLFYQEAGTSSTVSADDFNDFPETGATACIYGDLDKNKNWLRIDLPASFNPSLQNGDFQLRISAQGVSGQKVEFYDSSNPDNAPILDLKYGFSQSIPSSVEYSTDDIYQLFPNPSADAIFYLNNSDKIQTIRVFGLDGKQIAVDFNKESAQIRFLNSVQGIYLAQLFDENGNLLGLLKLAVQ
jgi:hypothetical protein